jgi:hypothetical protein
MSSLKFYESTGPFQKDNPMPARCTQIILKNGQSLLISPIKFSESQIAEVEKNPVKAIIAPNCFHHLHVLKAAENLKVSTLLCAEGLQQKRADVKWTSVLSEQTWPFADEVKMICVRGAPKINEAVFYHADSKTLITTDLFFNFQNLKPNLKNFIYKIMGTFNKPAVSRLVSLFAKDKNIFKTDLKRILELDFENLVMAHGKIINGNAKEIFINALKERGLY